MSSGAAEGPKASRNEAFHTVTVPPDWFKTVTVDYDVRNPWKDARLEVRRLLSLGGGKTSEAIKLTYMYVQKNDIGDGHEYPMYLFLGGEYAWALQQYRAFLKDTPKGYTHAYLSLSSCYRHFWEYGKALEVLNTATERLPDPPFRIARQADIHDQFGDVYAAMGDWEKAKLHYEKAIALYPASKQPYGRHLLHRRANKVQSKLDLFALRSIESGKIRDGTYTGRSLGYAEDMLVTVTVRNGTIADIKLKHKEKIDLNATTIIPRRILAKQSLQVDGITGATVTCQAIVDGALQALKKAGLR